VAWVSELRGDVLRANAFERARAARAVLLGRARVVSTRSMRGPEPQ
jgi:hypothetical protein